MVAGKLPWWKAPTLLLKRPGVAVALATAATVAALPAAGTPLLISASQSDSIAQQIESQCVLPSGAEGKLQSSGDIEWSGDSDDAVRSITGLTQEAFDDRVEAVDAEAGQVDALGAVERTMVLGGPKTSYYGFNYGVDTADGRNQVFIVYRDGAEDMIEPVEGDGPGIWIPDDLNRTLEVSAGETVTLGQIDKYVDDAPPGYNIDDVTTQYSPGSEPVDVDVEVAGVYQTLNRHPLGEDEWCHVQDVLQFDAMPEGTWFPTVLVDEETFWALAEQGRGEVSTVLQYELTALPALDDARDVSEQLTAMQTDLQRAGLAEIRTDIPRFTARAELVGGSLQLPVTVVALAAILVGLCIVGGSALLWVRRRRIELTVLAGRGASPAGLGVKGALEALPAIVLGGVAGYFVCLNTMRFWAPSQLVAEESPRWAAVYVAVVVTLALATMGLVSGRACRRLTEPVSAARRFGFLPWELIPAAAAAAAWMYMDDTTVVTAGEASERIGEVAQLPGRVFVVPLLAALALAIMVARITFWWWGRRARVPARVSSYLAHHRVRRDRWASAVMMAAIAVPTALAGYAATASASVGATIDAQARAEIGAEAVVMFDEYHPLPDDIDRFGAATEVIRIDNITIDRIRTSVLYVDVDTFTEAADTVDMLAGRSVVEALNRPQQGDAVPVVVAGSDRITDGDATLKLPGSVETDVDVMTVDEVPAKRGGMPVVLVSDRYLPDDLGRVSHYQWWVNTDDGAGLRDYVRAQFADESRMMLANERYLGTPKHSVIKSVEYLLWVSILTALVVVVGMLLQLESRSTANRRAFVMMRRMGLRSGSHRMALLREIGVVLTCGVVFGVLIATGLTAVMAPDFDIDRLRAPGVIVSISWAAGLALAAATLFTAVAAAWFGHARIAAARPSEVLRDAT